MELSLEAGESRWTDGKIELRVIRVLPSGDLSRRSPETAFLAASPEIRFSVHLVSSGSRIGRIHLRVTDDDGVVERLGHAGYAIDPDHQQRGYATRALRLLLGVARDHGLSEVILFISPDNTASRRVAEKVGFADTGGVDTSSEPAALGLGAEQRRYLVRL